MKKKILLMLAIPMIIFGFNSDVNAIYNGGSGAIGKGLGGCPENSSTYCKWNNRRHLTMQVSLYYFNADGSRSQIGRTVIATNNNFLDLSGDNVYADLPTAAGNNESINSDYLEKYFLDYGGLELYLSRISPGLTLEHLTLPSEEACAGCNAKYGYRIILEPIISWVHNNRIIGGTIKELARMNVELSYSKRWTEFSMAMHTEFDDVGITTPISGTTNKLLIAAPNIGYGYNIIDITDKLIKTYSCPDGTKQTEMTGCVTALVNKGTKETTAISTCEKQYCTTPITPSGKCWGHIVTDGNPAVCTNYNSNNIGSFYEKYVKSCRNTANEYGTPEDYFVDETCRLYCLESASQYFPGNVSGALSKGTILVWPTSSTNNNFSLNNIYPISFSGKRTCTLVMDGSDDDIYQKANPIDKYNQYYDYVIANFNKLENVNSVINPDIEDFIHTKKTLDQIRTSYNGQWALSQDSCNAYYAEALNKLNASLSSAYSARTAWVNAHPASTMRCTRPVEVTIREAYTEQNCDGNKNGVIEPGETCWHAPVKKTTYVGRDCTEEDYDYNDQIQRLENVKTQIASALNTCIAYVNNYVGMAGTYVQVASCNNKFIDSSALYDFQTNASMSFEGADGTEYVTLNVESQNYSCNNCNQSNKLTTDESNTKNLYFFSSNYNKTQFANLVNSINAGGSRQRVATVSANVTYTLPSGTVTEDKGNGNYTQANYYGFKISKNSKIGVKYDLKIFNTHLGHKNKFGSLLNKNGTYTCDYEVTETVTEDCVCPPGTDHEGENLYCMIADSSTTCIEAQVDYCNDTTINIPDTCDADLYCTNDPTIKLNACVNAGRTFEECENILCNGSSTYRCKNTNNVGGNMDITSCVYTKLAQGYSLQESIDICDTLVCPGKGLRIIYRPISLENPFPGKTISGGIAGFNTDVKGRYPGANWNSLSIVKNDILYSRSNSQASYGSKIYQNEEPLYTFVLNTAIINEIRKYNDTHKYDDFNLDCKKNNSLACVSAFVHDSSLSGIVGGTCQYNTSKTNFYKCSNDT